MTSFLARRPLQPRGMARQSGTGGKETVFTLPNVLTVAGIASSVVWLAGGSGWWALLGLILDELDGRIARATGQTSELGSSLDWAGDVAINAATIVKLGPPFIYALPVVMTGQMILRDEGTRPSIGSARAVTTLFALYKQGFFR